MGKYTDAILAIIILIIGIWFLTRMHLSAGGIWNMFKSFFFGSGSSGSTNTSSSGLLILGLTNSKTRNKIQKKIENIRRMIFSRSIKNEQKEANRVNRRESFEK